MIQLSIIIPAYITSAKGADDLSRLVEKAARQIDPDLHEIIVVDDHSPVVFGILCRRNVGEYRLEKNRGAAAARNFGIDHSSGKYIVFLDADDDIPDDFIAILNNRIDFEERSGAPVDIVQFQAKHEDGNLAYPEPCAWGKLILRKWIGNDRFDEDQLIGEEDTLFHNPKKKTPRIAKDGRIIYYHRQSANPDSLMKRFWRGEIPRRREDV